jgi:hypothetical protein
VILVVGKPDRRTTKAVLSKGMKRDLQRMPQKFCYGNSEVAERSLCVNDAFRHQQIVEEYLKRISSRSASFMNEICERSRAPREQARVEN